MIVEGLFSDSGFGQSVLKESGDKILEKSELNPIQIIQRQGLKVVISVLGSERMLTHL